MYIIYKLIPMSRYTAEAAKNLDYTYYDGIMYAKFVYYTCYNVAVADKYINMCNRDKTDKEIIYYYSKE